MKNSLLVIIVGFSLLATLSRCTSIRDFLGFGYTAPEVNLVSLDVANVSFSSLSLKVGLEVKNPNDYDLTFKKMDYKIKAMELEMATGSYDQTFTAPSNGVGRVKLPVEVKVQNALKLMNEFVNASKSDTEILMEADIIFDSPIGEIKKHFESMKKLKDL